MNYGEKYWNEAKVRAAAAVALWVMLATAGPLAAQPAVDPASEAPSEAEDPAPTAAPLPVFDTYRIGVGDVLAVNVWKEPDHSIDSLVVRPDGMISLPLLREISAVGLTPLELEDLLTERFKEFINNPTVTVVIRDIRSQMVHLTGAVNRPGSLLIQPGMTVWQALSEGGGVSQYGKRKKMYIIREINGERKIINYDYTAVVKGEIDKDMTLRPGDTIVVPE